MAKGGKRPGAGRKLGTPNKLTADVKDAIKAAFGEVGGTAYLVEIAKADPRTFCSLLGKLVPTTVGGDPDGDPIKQIIEVITGVPRKE
jgi:hypothetical protein